MLMQRLLSRALSTSSLALREGSSALKASLESVAKSQSDALLLEQCILVNEQDHIIGSASKLDCHKWDPNTRMCPLHRAFSVFLFNSRGELLLQQRSDDKVTFPGHYTNSCCSHPLSVEGEREGVKGAVQAARRRLNYELGILQEEALTEDFSYLTRILYSGRVAGSPFAEHEVDYIFFLQKDVALQPNPEEVKHVEYVARDDIHEYLAALQHQKVAITPWFSLIMKHFLLNWWDNLDSLEKFKDHENIHKL